MALDRYGITWDFPEAGTDPSASIELSMAFHPDYSKASGCLGAYQHLHNAIDLIWNEPRRRSFAERRMEYDPRKHDAFIWNEWTEDMIETLCEFRTPTSITGPNASWKTTAAGVFVVSAWMAQPLITSVVLTSTSLKGLRKRIYGEASKYYNLARPGFGDPVPSQHAIRMAIGKGEEKAGIYGFATGQQEGEVKKAAADIIGYHNEFVIAVVDEAQETNRAITEATISLRAGTRRFQLIVLGNADSELDEHGRLSEPVNGWDSVSVDDEKWETKAGGVCLHLDGTDSPRAKLGDEFYPGLLTRDDIESAKKEHGEDSPFFWKYRRGFWAPQGVQRTVLSMALVKQGNAMDSAVWVGEFTEIAHLDPSFEGNDRCVLRFSKCGLTTNGKTVLALGTPIVIKVKVSAEEPIHYQIVRQVKEECIKRNIPPERFALDSTGEGGGLASIFLREWGPGITLVEFGGRPSTDPISETNPKRADMEYDRKVTELHYRFRTLVMNSQIRQLDVETATEFCQRRYEMKGNLVAIETKTIMKQRTRRSPDFSDNAVVGAELARRLGLLGGSGSAHSSKKTDRWREFAKKYDVTSDYLVA